MGTFIPHSVTLSGRIELAGFGVFDIIDRLVKSFGFQDGTRKFSILQSPIGRKD